MMESTYAYSNQFSYFFTFIPITFAASLMATLKYYAT